MAVYTEVLQAQAQPIFDRLGLGVVTSMRGIQSGIENTNYFVDAGGGEYVLTLFERLTPEQLPYYLHLALHLAEAGLPAPAPQRDAAGELLFSLNGKPAAVAKKLPGQSVPEPDVGHCRELGGVLARMHLAAVDFPLVQPNLRGISWWNDTAPQVAQYLPQPVRALLQSELAHQNAVAASDAYATLPRGAVHADLFRDNVFFEQGRLSGVFDFYFAGADTWTFDLGVVLNDWCIDWQSGLTDEARAGALLEAYQAVRPLTHEETKLLPQMMRAAALRFWISRLWDYHQPREASLLVPHDPAHFERVLRWRISEAGSAF